jgi:alpha-galactosidase
MEPMTACSFAFDPMGFFSFTGVHGIRVSRGEPAVVLADGKRLGPGDALERHVELASVRLAWENGLRLAVHARASASGVEVDATLENHGTVALPIGEIRLFDAAQLDGTALLDRTLLNGEDMNGFSGVVDVSQDRVSNSVVGLTNATSNVALVLGFMDVREVVCGFEIGSRGGPAHTLSAVVKREGITLKPGGSVATPSLHMQAGESLSSLMDAYAEGSGRLMGARHTPLHTGWCSWYTYYGTETVEDVLRNVKTLARSRVAPNLKTIQIDDGWNYTAAGAPRNWGDWEAGYKFPKGMKDIADRIKDAGFSPGLWVAPFSIDRGSNFFREHPDLLVQDGTEPKLFWECFGLDLTHPRAIEWVRETFDRVLNNWGFEYIKIDFLLHAIQPGKRHDNSLTTAQVLRRGLQAIRDVAGEDRFILTCGCPMAPAVGICDAMRIGPDVSHRWYLPMNLTAWPWGNCSIYSGAHHVLGRQWMDRRWWQNDPDCLVVHDDGSAGEKRMFGGTGDLGQFSTKPPYGLTDEEAAMWARLTWMSGGLGMIGENLESLSEPRLNLLTRAFPPNDARAQVVDYYVDSEIGVLRGQEPRPMIGLFNLSEKPHTIRLSRSKSRLDEATLLREWLTGERITVSGDMLEFPELAPRSGRIWIEEV